MKARSRSKCQGLTFWVDFYTDFCIDFGIDYIDSPDWKETSLVKFCVLFMS